MRRNRRTRPGQYGVPVPADAIPAAVPAPPARPLPAGACDCHAHVFGPFDRYPLSSLIDYVPPLAPHEAYIAMLDRIGCERGVLVHSTQQTLDNSITLDLVEREPGRLRAIGVLAPGTPPDQLAELDRRGMRGLRFVEMRSPDGHPLPETQSFDTIAPRAEQMAALGWHAQLWAPCATLAERLPGLLELGLPLVVDHMGWFDASLGVAGADFQALLGALATSEQLWVKLPPQRPSKRFPDYEDVRPFFEAFACTRPDRLVWGSDYPHLHLGELTPDVGHILDLLADWCADEALLRTILVDNPARLYGF
jgi:predicted TIM-barrel fold metal-dependent hydrolase